ncbi:hypothetical protein BaRGS_00003128 [Batillaria attramentaria]|uniref:Uncharacterized protein n=1 Tax=Batillaria attramentaria TaxID=370345 RepID=A0ABD0M3S6_9CAEN
MRVGQCGLSSSGFKDITDKDQSCQAPVCNARKFRVSVSESSRQMFATEAVAGTNLTFTTLNFLVVDCGRELLIHKVKVHRTLRYSVRAECSVQSSAD